MAMTAEQKRERALKQQKAAQERARERQLAKLKANRERMEDPEEREKVLAKQREAQQRAFERQKAKQQDPEYRKKIFERSKNRQSKAREKAKTKPPAKAPVKKVTSKGLKGRTPTAYEREIMDKLGALPCMACLLKGRYNPVVSLHHMDGRTKPQAHEKTLPLCACHHDTPADKEIIGKYPDLLPYHAKGNLGGKAVWRRHNGDEWEMLAMAYYLIGVKPAFDLVELSDAQMEQLDFFSRLFS